MSGRRPRVKAIANIGVKRKIKEEIVDKPDVEIKSKEEPPNNNKIIKAEILPVTSDIPTPTTTTKTSSAGEEPKNISSIDNSDENLKSSLSDSQQIRPRQRIKATPCFDVRRNSIHGPNDEQQQIENFSGQMKEPKLPPPSAQNLFNSNRSPIANRTRTESVSSITQQQNVPTTNTTTLNTSVPPDHNHQHQQYFHNNYPQSREHIPPRHRKISTMEDAQRLSAARKEFNSKYSRKTPEKSVLKMFEFIYYNPSSNPMKFDEKCQASSNKLLNNELPSTAKLENEKNLETIESSNIQDEGLTDEPKNNETGTTPSVLPVPQLKLGPNGEIILDEKSLLIETTAEKQIRSNLAASKNFIYLDEYSGNNGFYSRQKRTKDWSPEETIKFYRCLHTVGTDFSLMLALFPNRTRRDLKLKFKKEEKNNGNLINKAILYPKAFDIEELKSEFQREEELIEEKRKQWKEIQEQQQQQDHQNNLDNNKSSSNSKAGRVLTKGDLAYKNENLSSQRKSRKKRESKKSKKNEQKIKKEIIKIEDDEENINNNKNNDDNEIINNIKSPEQINDNRRLVESTTSCGGVGGGGSVEITDIGEIFSFGDILPELKGCSLALVSSIDDNQNIEKVTHEIYIVCKKTGTLSNKPLDLPKDTIHCILLAMGKIEDT